MNLAILREDGFTKKGNNHKNSKIILDLLSKERNYRRQKRLDIEMQKVTDFLPNLNCGFFQF